jgi:hypothetical protein
MVQEVDIYGELLNFVLVQWVDIYGELLKCVMVQQVDIYCELLNCLIVEHLDNHLLFFIRRVAGHRKYICNSSLINIFSATSIGLKTLPDAEDTEHCV